MAGDKSTALILITRRPGRLNLIASYNPGGLPFHLTPLSPNRGPANLNIASPSTPHTHRQSQSQSQSRGRLPPRSVTMASSAGYDADDEETAKVEAGFSPDETNSSSSSAVVQLVQKLIAEVIGTFFVVFAGCGSVAVNKIDGQVTFPGICVVWGLIVMVMVYSVGHISGAHFNPAVTIAFTILKRFPLKELPLYITAQLLGSVLSSGTLYLLLRPQPSHFYGTVPSGSSLQSFILEIIITFLLMFVISGVSTDTRAIGELAGIAVGSTILLNVFVAGPISGASMNPARSIGPAIIMQNYKGLWLYILGPIIGALAGGFAYNLIRFSDEPLREITNSASFLKSTSRNK